jgi:hypothetical protein
MKVKLGDVYVSVGVLNKILDTELPVTVSYKMMKLVNKLNEELKTVEEQRVKLVKKYSSSTENTVSEDNKNNFLQEFSTLLESEIDLDWEKIALKTLDKDIKLSVNDLSKVQYLFSE